MYKLQQEREYNIESQKYTYWLCNVAGIGNKTIANLWEQIGDSQTIYRADEHSLQGVLKQKQINALYESKQRWSVEKEYDKLLEHNVRFYPFMHPDYPARLRVLPDAPAAIYCIGKLPSEMRPAVAIIGARNCSAYGSAVAKEIAKEMARAGVSVVSGMARGIDGIAQRAAMEAGGETFGVLGSGVLVCYPQQNKAIYEAMKVKGGLISEYHPYMQPQTGFFPARNRIISALSEAVIIIEAKEKSGTCITVDMALEQGKEVYAVPGRVNDPLSRGCNRMIEQGAGIITDIEGLPEQLFGVQVPEREKVKKLKEKYVLSEMEKAILEALGTTPVLFSKLCQQIQSNNAEITVDMSEIRKNVLQMVVKGYVKAVGGSYFQRIFDERTE